jgi:uncharacterized protein (UPF0303 family)
MAAAAGGGVPLQVAATSVLISSAAQSGLQTQRDREWAYEAAVAAYSGPS